jgi:hypothetical protein
MRVGFILRLACVFAAGAVLAACSGSPAIMPVTHAQVHGPVSHPQDVPQTPN